MKKMILATFAILLCTSLSMDAKTKKEATGCQRIGCYDGQLPQDCNCLCVARGRNCEFNCTCKNPTNPTEKIRTSNVILKGQSFSNCRGHFVNGSKCPTALIPSSLKKHCRFKFTGNKSEPFKYQATCKDPYSGATNKAIINFNDRQSNRLTICNGKLTAGNCPPCAQLLKKPSGTWIDSTDASQCKVKGSYPKCDFYCPNLLNPCYKKNLLGQCMGRRQSSSVTLKDCKSWKMHNVKGTLKCE